MAFFHRSEVTFLKESSDARLYLEKLESLQNEVKTDRVLSDRIAKEIAVTKAGIIGEDAIQFELRNSGMDLVVLHDLYIESPEGNSAQIDYIVITPYANFVLECKNLFGNLEIDSKGNFIRTIKYGNKTIREGIYSPITQNERHLLVLKQCKTASHGALLRALVDLSFEKFHIPLVVLSNPKTIVNDRFAPESIKDKVIRVDQLITVLRNKKTNAKSSKAEMLTIGERFLTLHQERRKEYITKFERMKEESIARMQTQRPSPQRPVEAVETTDTTRADDGGKKICPWCGSALVLRTAKKGVKTGKQFYGCSGFPRCRYILNIE